MSLFLLCPVLIVLRYRRIGSYRDYRRVIPIIVYKETQLLNHNRHIEHIKNHIEEPMCQTIVFYISMW